MNNRTQIKRIRRLADKFCADENYGFDQKDGRGFILGTSLARYMGFLQIIKKSDLRSSF